MIAGQTACTIALVKPLRSTIFANNYIVSRAYVGTQTTLNATVVNPKRPVGNHLSVEKAANNVGIEARCRTFLEVFDAFGAVGYFFDESLQLLFCNTDFLLLALLRVGVHERKTHV